MFFVFERLLCDFTANSIVLSPGPIDLHEGICRKILMP